VASNSSRWSLRGLFQSRQRTQREATQASPHIITPYHAVSILTGRCPCSAALHLSAVRFLSSEAPRLPLENCNAPVCECRYQHHKDRRSSDRRRPDVWSSGRSWVGKDRRASHGRRKDDI
jgi:hypothetical protein